MRFKKLSLLVLLGMLLASIFIFSGCEAADVVAKVSLTSFDALVKAVPAPVIFDSEKGGWVINGMDGKERIILSTDFSSDHPDIVLELDAAPFLNAGLDASKLPGNQYRYDAATGKIEMAFEYGAEKFGPETEKSALDAFRKIVKAHRNIIGYHEEGDHYKIDLGNGNSFAWAKELSTNKTDMAFILNPKPWVDAGVDTAQLKEWAFIKMPVIDKEGKPAKVDVFIKGFNVK